MAEGVYQSKGYAQYQDLSSVVDLLDAPDVGDPAPDGAYRAELQAETQNIRYTTDGTDPDATTGMILYAGDAPSPFEGDLDKLRLIEAAGGAVLNVTYYGL